MKNTLFVLFAMLAIAGVASADYRVSRPVVTAHAHRPQIVQFAFPSPAFGAPFGTFGTYSYPYQAQQFAAIVDQDGVVRLIELRQLRGLQSPLQLSPQPYQSAPVQVIPGR